MKIKCIERSFGNYIKDIGFRAVGSTKWQIYVFLAHRLSSKLFQVSKCCNFINFDKKKLI